MKKISWIKRLGNWIKKYLIPVSKKYSIKYLKLFGYKITDKDGKEI